MSRTAIITGASRGIGAAVAQPMIVEMVRDRPVHFETGWNLRFLPVISTCETGITIAERTFDTV
jgi:hypothetical protein